MPVRVCCIFRVDAVFLAGATAYDMLGDSSRCPRAKALVRVSSRERSTEDEGGCAGNSSPPHSSSSGRFRV